MVLHHCEPPFGGPEVQALRLAARFERDGHQVVVVARGSGNYPMFERVDGIPVYRLNHPGLASLELSYRLFKLRDSFDIIHVHGAGRLATAAIRFACCFDKKVFVKVTMNGGLVKPAKPGLLGLAKRMNPFRNSRINQLKQAAAMIAITHDMVDDLRRHDFPETRIFYIPNGVDTNLFYPASDTQKRQIRLQLNLPLDKTVYVFTGKITRRKGIDTLLAAWLDAVQTRRQAVLVIAGSGTGQKDSLEQYAQAFISEHQLQTSVIMTGAVDNVADYLRAADVFVFPSRWEGLPNSLLEAMAVALICIASDIEGVNEIIIPGETGILVPAGDAAAWSRALDAIDQSRNRVLAENAAAVIRHDFSLDSTVRKLEQLFMTK